MNNVVPFVQYLADILLRMEAATERVHIEYLRVDNGAVLRGYYLAGVVSLIEYRAAIQRFNALYEEKLGFGRVRHKWTSSDERDAIVGYQ